MERDWERERERERKSVIGILSLTCHKMRVKSRSWLYIKFFAESVYIIKLCAESKWAYSISTKDFLLHTFMRELALHDIKH